VKGTRLFVVLAALVVTMIGASAAPGHVQPNVKLGLADSTSATGGFANVGMNAGHVLRVVSSLKGLLPNTTYDVWLINCATAPGGHPCIGGPLTGTGPIGPQGSVAGCVGAAGPLATVTTNAAGNANTGAVLVNLSGVAAGTYYFHLDIGVATACHPGGASPPGMFFTDGFSVTI
jgi:hypothetical protein